MRAWWVGMLVVVLAAVAAADRVMVPEAGFAPPPEPPMHRPPVRQPPPPPPAPPPAEIGELAKRIGGTYQCKGALLAPSGASTPLVAQLVVKPALGGAWLELSLAPVKPDPRAFRFDEYRTYDAVAKQWTRIQLASTTGHAIATSPGESAGAWQWDGTQVLPTGTVQLRDHETIGERQLALWGEALLGGDWQKTYEITCKR